jgi:hypothetical protein
MAIQSLFGPSPAQVMEQRRKEQEQEILQQGREFGMFAPLYQAGLRFGEQGRQSLQSMFPGQQDAALQEATAVQSVLAKYQGENIYDPSVLTKIAEDLGPVAPNAGLKALTLARELTSKQESAFAKINPKDYTPESIQVFNQTKDYSALVPRQADKPAEQRIRETRISGLVTRGYSPNFATDIVDGNIKYEANPATGMMVKTNKLTGTSEEVPLGSLNAAEQGLILAAAEEAEGQTLWEAAKDGTGFWSAARAGASRIVGQIPGAPVAEKTEEARQTLEISSNEFARALVNNPKFAVAEVERVLKEAGTKPGAFDTPELMRSRLKTLDTFLKSRLRTAESDAKNTRLPQDLRSAQASNAAAIRAFLPKLGVPGSGEKPPKGITQQQWNAMTEAQRAKFRK